MIRINVQILGLVLLAGFLCASDVVAQRGGGLLDLLSIESVQKELEMSSDQVAELETLKEESRERRNEARQEIRESFRNGGDRESAMQRARELFGELAKEDEADIEGVLIGDQFDRLKQVSIQRDLAGRNSGSAMERLLELVEATDDEKDKFEEVKEKLEKEAAAKIAKIRAQTVEQIARQSLSSAKADKFMDFIGEAMEGGVAALQNQNRNRSSRGDRSRGDRDRNRKRPEGDEF